jgi:choline monooxygenase
MNQSESEKKINRFHVDEDIAHAVSLPGAFYTHENLFQEIVEKIFVPSWQWVGSMRAVRDPGTVWPFRLLEPLLNEPLVLTRDAEGNLFCLSNVCPHRGNLVAQKPGACTGLRCSFHGRRFGLNGTLESVSEYEADCGSGNGNDHLAQLPIFTFGKFIFTSLKPAIAPVHIFGEMIRRTGWMPFEQFHLDSTRTSDEEVEANWAVCVELFLGRPHNENDETQFRTELYPWTVVKTSFATKSEPIFHLPVDHPDFGQDVSGYHFWLFPNLLFRFHPWGLSLTLITPLSVSKCRVRSLTYVWQPEYLMRTDSAKYRANETEEFNIAANVQLGLQSRSYQPGPFSPSRDRAIHHFQKLVSNLLK